MRHIHHCKLTVTTTTILASLLCASACYQGLDDVDGGNLYPAGDGTPFDRDDDAASDLDLTTQTIRDEIVGASLTMPASWTTKPDPVLFENGYGFLVLGPDDDPEAEGSHDREALGRIALRTDRGAAELENAIDEKMEQYADFDLERVEVELEDGSVGIALTGLPGVNPYSVVFVPDGDRLYEVGLWSDAEHEIGERGYEVLNGLALHEPRIPVGSLALAHAEDALYAQPPPDIAARNAEANADRTAALQASQQDGDTRIVPNTLGSLKEPASGYCGFAQPDWLLWQLQWDDTNAFYYGDWYYLQSESGWSAMSGNYGSWWGTNYHVGLCYTGSSNQYYANDWPAYYWDNVYAAFAGWVEWAGWGTDGFYTLGNYVVVNDGNGYRNVSAHLTSIPDWIYWGAYVQLDTVIGYAGDTGGDWAPHIHARVTWGESLTYNGQPYGGHSVWPIGLRCWTCYDPDYGASVGGWYTEFWHGRWMRH